MFKELKKKVLSISLESDIPQDEFTVTVIVKTITDDPMLDIRNALAKVPGLPITD